MQKQEVNWTSLKGSCRTRLFVPQFFLCKLGELHTKKPPRSLWIAFDFFKKAFQVLLGPIFPLTYSSFCLLCPLSACLSFALWTMAKKFKHQTLSFPAPLFNFLLSSLFGSNEQKKCSICPSKKGKRLEPPISLHHPTVAGANLSYGRTGVSHIYFLFHLFPDILPLLFSLGGRKGWNPRRKEGRELFMNNFGPDPRLPFQFASAFIFQEYIFPSRIIREAVAVCN